MNEERDGAGRPSFRSSAGKRARGDDDEVVFPEIPPDGRHDVGARDRFDARPIRVGIVVPKGVVRHAFELCGDTAARR